MRMKDYDGIAWSVEKASKNYNDVAEWDISGAGDPANVDQQDIEVETVFCGCYHPEFGKVVWWVSPGSDTLGE